jgi:tetratricopeptide (TPR) repeat protein
LIATAEADLENSLAYAPQFLLFATHLFAGNKAAAEAALAQINPTEAHDFSPAFGDEISGFHWSPHFWKAAERLIEDEPRSDAGVRIAALRGLDTAVSHLGGANRLKDLEIALTRWRYDYRLFAAKAETLLEENRHDEALDAFLRAQMLSDENLYIPWDSIIPTCVRTKSSRKSLVKAVTQCLADTAPLGGRRRFVQTGVEGLIRAIHDANAYDTNLELIELFTPAELAGAGLDFTVAYSLANNAVPNSERALRAIKLYEKLLRDAASVSAAGNNLGILYEEHGRLVDAEKAYLASVTANPQGSHAPASLLRVRAELEKIAAHERALVTAGEFFLREELTTQRVVQDIVNHIASDGAIHLKKDKLQKLLGASQYDLASRVQPFLTRRYFDLEKADSLQRDPVVLKPNPQLLAVIQRQHVEHDEELRRNAVAAGLAPGNLDQRYGFNAVLLERLNIVSSVALQAQLRRDMREAVHALVVGSHKSALILCGSISEALLYDRLSGMKAQSLETLKRLRTREGRKVKSSDRDLRTWSLETLLNVASELAIISQTLFYFGHGIRGYRNLVHPAVELRGILEVSEGNASIAWTVVKDLLKALHLSSDLGSGDTSH